MDQDITGLRAIFPETDWDSPEVLAGNDDFNAYWDMLDLLVLRRKEAGLTQTDIANRMKSKQSAVSEIESLGSRPRIDTVQRYARAAGYKIVFELVKVEDDAAVETGDAR
ncbi:DNA-binding XRE family transcriptional regulator [Aurantimicrobium minutum]|uniref:helix-turn-helix domain-containing protein n=1 Tax=Aurantimicrobium minutum TaxID=708131 RepID=UPI0024741CF8|nr:helix-turn-helix transcriptional regulator [Aurantimicrobium minutum]MDH6532496.1 DNA-binding XRE family transcriptional regulator [Aurantimicrobium minutum]